MRCHLGCSFTSSANFSFIMLNKKFLPIHILLKMILFLRSHLQLYSIYVCIKIFYLFLMWTPQIYNSLDFSITNHMIDFICRTFAFCKSQGNVDFDCLCKKSTSLLILVESATKPELIYFREQWRRIIYKGIRIDPNV